MQSIHQYSYQQNRFYCLWSSNRPPASVRVNASGRNVDFSALTIQRIHRLIFYFLQNHYFHQIFKLIEKTAV